MTIVPNHNRAEQDRLALLEKQGKIKFVWDSKWRVIKCVDASHFSGPMRRESRPGASGE